MTVRLHHAQLGDYDVAGTSLLLYREVNCTSSWRLGTTDQATRDWLHAASLHDAKFDTLTDARRTLSAHIALTPPPASGLPRLQHAGAGRYVTPDGRWTITKHPSGSGWRVALDDGVTVLVPTLYRARTLIRYRTSLPAA